MDLHTVENYLQEIYSRRQATRQGYEGTEGEAVKPPRRPRRVPVQLRRGRHCSQRMAAVVHRGKHRGYQRGTTAPIQDIATCYTLFATRRNARVLPSRDILFNGTINRATTKIMADFCKD